MGDLVAFQLWSLSCNCLKSRPSWLRRSRSCRPPACFQFRSYHPEVACRSSKQCISHIYRYLAMEEKSESKLQDWLAAPILAKRERRLPCYQRCVKLNRSLSRACPILIFIYITITHLLVLPLALSRCAHAGCRSCQYSCLLATHGGLRLVRGISS